jgi:hypothetical protein
LLGSMRMGAYLDNKRVYVADQRMQRHCRKRVLKALNQGEREEEGGRSLLQPCSHGLEFNFLAGIHLLTDFHVILKCYVWSAMEQADPRLI